MDKWKKVVVVFTLTWATVACTYTSIWPDVSAINWYLVALFPAGIVGMFYAKENNNG